MGIIIQQGGDDAVYIAKAFTISEEAYAEALRKAMSQPRDDHGRWAAHNGGNMHDTPNAEGSKVTIDPRYREPGESKTGIVISSSADGNYHTVQRTDGGTAVYHGSNLHDKTRPNAEESDF